MTEEQLKPLWEVMEEAFLKGRQPGHSDPHGYAAELRAIADEVVPEEQIPHWEPVPKMHERFARHRIRQRLLAAADEAENGVGSDG